MDNSVEKNVKEHLINIPPDRENSKRNPEVTLETLIFYESLLNRKARNISWIDGSNDEISYKNPRDDIEVLNVTAVLEENKSPMLLRNYYMRQFNAENFIISPDKSYIAILWDEHTIYKTNLEYRVSIKEFNSGIEKKIVKNGDFVSHFSFSAKDDDNYSYTYKDKGVPKHYKCSLNDRYNFSKTREFCEIEKETCYKFTGNWWGSEQEKDYSVPGMHLNYKACWNDDENTSLNDTMIDGILYQEKGTILLYPRVETFMYNRAAPKIPPELKDSKNPDSEDFQDIINVSNDFKNQIGSTVIIREKKHHPETDENYIATTKSEGPNFGTNRLHVEHVSHSFFREEPLNLDSIEYTIAYPEENAVFYSLLGRNNSYYFPSKERAFFIKPAHGTIQLDTTPWVLHPIVYRNEITGLSTFNMAISTSSGFNPESQDTSYSYGPFFSHWNTIPKNRYTPLLSSEYFVTRILKVRKDTETDDLFAYFIAAPTTNVSRRNLYKIRIEFPPNEMALMEPVTCLTCPEAYSEGGLEMSKINPQCLWADVEMSHLGDYYLLHCKGPDVPWTVIVHTQTNRVLLNLRENEDIRVWDASIKKPGVHEFEIKLADGFIGRVRMQFPPEWHPAIKKCPRHYKLLLHVDGTPEGQLVTEKYKISWLWYLILEKNFVVLEADVRGSGYQSIDMSSANWRKIGKLEILDQISVVEYVLKTVNCIDKNQVAVYGEAYGGYTALNVMVIDDKKIFKCCAAVSPITTWQHYSHAFGMKVFGGQYDNIFRTRYEEANLASRAFGLKNKDFIIYSGTMDHEVLRYHMNNLLIALADNGIFFKHQQYIDQGHNIPDYRVHLYEHMYQYFNHCFASNNEGFNDSV